MRPSPVTVETRSQPVESQLKIAVYCIAKNEERHKARFMNSVSEADLVLVADTGSTDGTIAALRSHGAMVHEISISPWRFDDACNTALASLPRDVDVCISLDLDEILVPDWRAALQQAWGPATIRLRYPFVASWTSEGQPGTVFINERVHARHGYRWRMPIHEVVVWCGESAEAVVKCDNFRVEHHPDETKSLAIYLPMLQRLAAELPDDPRAAHYLGREYFFWCDYSQATIELQRSLKLAGATWPPQRAEACRLLGKCHDALAAPSEALRWYWKAVVEHPSQRESWVDLGLSLYLQNDFAGGYYAMQRALAITQIAPDYFNEPSAWGALPHDVLSVCAWKMGHAAEAADHARRAAALAPYDERLQANVMFFNTRGTEQKGSR